MKRIKLIYLATLLIIIMSLFFSCIQRDYKTKEFDENDSMHPKRFILDSEDSFTCYYVKKDEIVCYDSNEVLRVVYVLDKKGGSIQTVSSYKGGKKHGFFINSSRVKPIEKIFYMDSLVFDCLVPKALYLLRPVCKLESDTLDVEEPLGIDITLFSRKDFKVNKGILMIYNEEGQRILKEPFDLNRNGGAYIKIKNFFKKPGKYILECLIEENKEDKYRYILERAKKEFYVVD